jgi:hypothetical protein
MKKESPCRTGQSEKQILTGSAATLPHPLDEGRDLMLTKEDLAVKLKVALRTIENWQHEGLPPVYQNCQRGPLLLADSAAPSPNPFLGQPAWRRHASLAGGGATAKNKAKC